MPKVINQESSVQDLHSKADSLFNAGNYEYAKVKYSKICATFPETDAAKTAQYYLGYINVYYDNPFANWEAALREFKTFATLYPQDYRIDEVNSWIRILVVMQSFKKEYQGTISKLDLVKLKEHKENDSKFKKVNIDFIIESLKRCDDDRDSLAKKTKDLENVIIDLERKCQQAGK
jgi:outer membrane protein assembly factor BamD (BamD/ComL family)